MKKKRISTETKRKLKVYFMSVMAGLIVYLLAMVVSSLIISNADVPVVVISILSLISAGLFSFASSFLLAKITRFKGIITGAIMGLIVFIIISIVSYIFSEPGSSSVSLINFIVTVLSGVIGGVIGINSRALKIK